MMALAEKALELIRQLVQVVYQTEGCPLQIEEAIEQAWRDQEGEDELEWREWFRSLTARQRRALLRPGSRYDPWRLRNERLRRKIEHEEVRACV